jgi:hypothetical protein
MRVHQILADFSGAQVLAFDDDAAQDARAIGGTTFVHRGAAGSAFGFNSTSLMAA